nr:MAG TPA: hypothetical protein [Caudoviricetes sp.]
MASSSSELLLDISERRNATCPSPLLLIQL